MMSQPGCGRVVRGVGGSVQRCLFGEVDHEQLQHDYTLLIREELEDASRRWSFDFTTNRPLMGGDFEWVGLPEARVPFLYQDRKIVAENRSKGAESEFTKEDIPNTPEQCDANTQNAEKHTLKRKQTNITDFYQAKRRVVTTRKSGQ